MKFDQLILRKIITVKNYCCHQMPDFNAKMPQNRFRLGLRPDPAGGAYSAPPDPLAGFKGPTSKGRGGKGRGGLGWKAVGGDRGRGGGREGGVGWSPLCEILNTPL